MDQVSQTGHLAADYSITKPGEAQKATFGGGCFWCTEALFQQLKGVIRVESGYSGGTTINPTYREVSSGLTGHAEVVEVTYLPSEISLEELLRIHLATHNPTLVNGPGTQKSAQYRSIIFYRNEAERATAQKVLEEARPLFDKPVATQLLPFERFYKAEPHHQNYYNNHPEGGYCTGIIHPKLKQLRELFTNKVKLAGG